MIVTAPRISAIILTYNEEDNIRRTLNALRTLDEVIIVDSGSTDLTRQIIEEFPNATAYTRSFDNMMNQWNYGLSLAKHDWVLSLDADYLISEALLDEIARLNTTKTGYEASFRYCIYGHPLRSGVLPPRVIYFDRRKCRYIQDGHTQSLVVDGETGKLHHHVFHDDRKNLGRWFWSQQNYSGQESMKLTSGTSRLSLTDRLRKYTVLTPFLILFYCLIWKGGIFEGRRGLFYAFQRMYAETILVLQIMDQKLNRISSRNH